MKNSYWIKQNGFMVQQTKLNKENRISVFRTWFLLFSPLLYFSFNLGSSLNKMMKHENSMQILYCKIDSLDNNAGRIGNKPSVSGYSKIGDKWVYLDFSNLSEENSNYEFTQDYIEKNKTIKIWYNPNFSTAWIITQKNEQIFPFNKIIKEKLNWFIGFTILPFYFFCRWVIEWIRVKQKKK